MVGAPRYLALARCCASFISAYAPATSPAAKDTSAAITYCPGAPRPPHQGPWQYLWRGFDHGCSRAALRAIFVPAAEGTAGGTIMDDQGDGAEPVRIMTYRDLAAALGIDEESAQRRAQRRKWRRMRGNDGKTRVAVPMSVIPDAPADSPSDYPPDNGGQSPRQGRVRSLPCCST